MKRSALSSRRNEKRRGCHPPPLFKCLPPLPASGQLLDGNNNLQCNVNYLQRYKDCRQTYHLAASFIRRAPHAVNAYGFPIRRIPVVSRYKQHSFGWKQTGQHHLFPAGVETCAAKPIPTSERLQQRSAANCIEYKGVQHQPQR